MDTLEFLRKVLPSKGVYLLAYPSLKGFRHLGFTSLEEMASKAVELDQSTTVYHACASYMRKPYQSKTEDGRKTWVARREENWCAARSFWIDMDVGKEKAAKGAGYATKREAAADIIKFCQKYELPVPMMVCSGYGLHCYWVMDRDLTPEQWIPTANTIKSALAIEGVKQDPSRTADFASVLRPVGTNNKKNGTSKPVRLLVDSLQIRADAFLTAINNMALRLPAFGLNQLDSRLEEIPDYLKTSEADNSSLTSKTAYGEYKVNPNKMADLCPVCAQVRDTQGDASYEHWRGVVGLLTFCDGGYERAVEWSVKRCEKHTNVDVDGKFSSWTSGPTTCKFFETHCPETCHACPHFGKIKTPLVLGREAPDRVAEDRVVSENDADNGVSDSGDDGVQLAGGCRVGGEEEEGGVSQEGEPSEAVVVEEVAQTEADLPKRLEVVPAGYDVQDGQLVRYVQQGDEVHSVCFCPNRFYLCARLVDECGLSSVMIASYSDKGKKTEFELDAKYIGTGGIQLLGALGQHEIVSTTNKDADRHMAAYLKDALTALKKKVGVTRTFTSFGWQGPHMDKFLLGDRLYIRGKKPEIVLLRKHAEAKKNLFPNAKGTVEGYADALNWIYNRPGMEPMQYAICSIWGAPLAPLMDSMYKGIPCALTGADSGKGKTTAFTAALYAFGDADKMTIKGDSGATANARMALLGTVSNLPILFDEVTNISPRNLSILCYALSNGGEPERLSAPRGGAGVVFAEAGSWNTHSGMTGNTDLVSLLALKGNSEAEAMRFFEIHVDDYDIPKLNAPMVAQKLTEMSENAGSAGLALIDFIVNHPKETQDFIDEARRTVHADQKMTKEPKYRFYRYHMICTLAAARIMKHLGVHAFDIDKMTEFAKQAVVALCKETSEKHNLAAEDILESIINENLDKIIITRSMDKPGVPVFMPKAEIVGRAVINPTNAQEPFNNTLYIKKSILSEWCSQNRISYKKFLTVLFTKKVIREETRLVLSRGLPSPLPQSRVYRVDLKSIQALGTTPLGELNEEPAVETETD